MAKKRIALKPDMDNVMSLDNAEHYRCRVVGYLLERSLMVIEVSRNDEQFYAVVPDVYHYDGAFLWQGASLRIATREEQFDYMLDRVAPTSEGLLFIFDGVDGQVRLLGGDWLGIFEDLPDRFK